MFSGIVQAKSKTYKVRKVVSDQLPLSPVQDFKQLYSAYLSRYNVLDIENSRAD